MREALNLTGKTAIVTGASRGIGKAIAKELSVLGANVAMLSRKPDAIQAAADEIGAATGGRVLALACHCGKAEPIREAVARIAEEFGGIDILVNNVATNPHFGMVLDGTPELFAKILETNVVGYYTMVQAVAPHMDKAGGGSVVNIASVAGISPAPFMGLYSVSKAAVIHLGKTLAKELGPRGIRVNTVAPGLIKTDFSRALWSNQAILDEVLKSQAVARIGEVEEPARMVAFLASEAAAFITGGVFAVDGGSIL